MLTQRQEETTSAMVFKEALIYLRNTLTFSKLNGVECSRVRKIINEWKPFKAVISLHRSGRLMLTYRSTTEVQTASEQTSRLLDQ